MLPNCVGIHTETSAAVSATDTLNTSGQNRPSHVSEPCCELLRCGIVGQVLICSYLNNQIDKSCIYRLFMCGSSVGKTLLGFELFKDATSFSPNILRMFWDLGSHLCADTAKQILGKPR